MDPLVSESPAEPKPRFLVAGALQQAASRSRVWMTITLAQSLLAWSAALPWLSHYRQALDHRREPGSTLGFLDETFRLDSATSRAVVETSVAQSGGVLAFLAMLFGAFCAGGWLQVLSDRTESHSVRRFLHGGGRYFLRFARVLLLTLLALHVLNWLVYGMPFKSLVLDACLGVREGNLENMVSEYSARMVVWLQDALFLAGLAGLFAWGDFVRTRLAILDSRSVLVAATATLGQFLRRPLTCWGPLVLIFVWECTGLAGFTLVSRFAERKLASGGGWLFLALVTFLGLLCIAWRSIARGARYAAAIEITKEILGEQFGHPRRDRAQRHTIGGPGGPRYPIDDQDEYSVSI